MNLKSPYPDVAIPDVSFGKYMLDTLDLYLNSIALIENDSGKALTYLDVKNLSLQCACAFEELGLRKGDVISVCITNSIYFPSLLIGAAVRGLVITISSPNCKKGELLKQYFDSNPVVVFTDQKEIGKMKELANEVKSVKHIFTIGMDEGPESFHRFCKTTHLTKEPPYATINSHDVLLLPYSSGTTGLPKGVMLTHRNVIAYAELSKLGFLCSRKEVVYLCIPMFFITGCYFPITTLTQGVKMVVAKRFTVTTFLEAVQRHKVTFMIAVPPMILSLQNYPHISSYDISSLSSICCTAAPLPTSVANKVMKKYNVRLYQEWGLTEGELTSAAIDTSAPIQSVGLCMPNTLLKVADFETGKPLNAQQHGELRVKGPQIMSGYFNNSTATKRSFDDEGWFRTGDIGYFDEHGYIFVIDRVKELIKYKGCQVAPAELEEILLRHPMIADAAVIGTEDPECGELPVAFVIKKDDSLGEGEIYEYMKDKVSSYKYFRGGIYFVKSIPKSASGKILRRQIKMKMVKPKM